MALPTLLLTRPHENAEAFAASLDPVARAGVRIVIAPLMEIVGTRVAPEMEPTAAAIFTSANGVLFAPRGQGRLAFCVGARTTEQARIAGWLATQAGNTAQELIANLSASPPAAPLWHLGGEHTIGDIATSLTAVGIVTRHVTLYHQALLPLDPAARNALEHPSIVPVFSRRSAQQLVDEAQNILGKAHIIALSDSVAAPFAKETCAECFILPSPQAIYMRKAVENLCLTLSLP